MRLFARWADEVVRAVALLAQAPRLAARRREAAALAVLVRRAADPVDARVVADHRVGRVDADDLVVLVRRVLVDPVRVEHAQVRGPLAHSFFSDGLEVPRELDLVDALVLGLAVDDAAVRRALARAAADGGPKNGVALLGLVAQFMGLVVARRPRHSTYFGLLAVLPRPDAHEVAEHVALLLLPELLEVLVGAHGGDLLYLRRGGLLLRQRFTA